MTRWLALTLGLAIAAAALYLLARDGTPERRHHASDQIDTASRARLERVLREAEREEARRR